MEIFQYDPNLKQIRSRILQDIFRYFTNSTNKSKIENIFSNFDKYFCNTISTISERDPISSAYLSHFNQHLRWDYFKDLHIQLPTTREAWVQSHQQNLRKFTKTLVEKNIILNNNRLTMFSESAGSFSHLMSTILVYKFIFELQEYLININDQSSLDCLDQYISHVGITKNGTTNS